MALRISKSRGPPQQSLPRLEPRELTPRLKRLSTSARVKQSKQAASPRPAQAPRPKSFSRFNFERVDSAVWGVMVFASMAAVMVPLSLATFGLLIPALGCVAALVTLLVASGTYLAAREQARQARSREEALARRAPPCQKAAPL